MSHIWIKEPIYNRLKQLADHKGINIHRLATLYLEMAVSFEEAQGKTEAVGLLEDVLARLLTDASPAAPKNNETPAQVA